MSAATETRPCPVPAFRNGLARKAAGLVQRHSRRRRLWRQVLAGSLHNRSTSQPRSNNPT